MACGITFSRRLASRLLVASSCGAVFGIAKIVAISPSCDTWAGATVAMPGVSATASCSAARFASLSGAPFGMSIASRNGPLEPAPNASLSRS